MPNPTITAVEVVQTSGPNVVKIDLEWVVEVEDVTVGARLTIPEARAWIAGPVSKLQYIETHHV